jgi:hypothetical protein
MKRNYWAVLAGFLLMGTAIAPARGEDANAMWQQVVQGSARERQSISTMKVSYDFFMQFQNPQQGRRLEFIHRHVNYGEDGHDYYENDSTSIKANQPIVANGVVVKTAAGLFQLTRSATTEPTRLATPSPDQLIQWFSTSEIEQMRRQGDCRIVSAVRATVDGQSVLKFVFGGVDGDSETLETWYAESGGFWPVFTRQRDAKGHLLAEISGVKLTKVTQNGKDYFYPISGTTRSFDYRGDVSVMYFFSADPKSVHVNELVTADEFQLPVSP